MPLPPALERVAHGALSTFARALYRLRIENRHHLPTAGGALVVANHVTLIDWLFLYVAARRRVCFVMYRGFLHFAPLRWLSRRGVIIPIAPAHEDPECLSRAFDSIASALAAGDVVCLFPEGKLTRSGRMNEFRTGVERIVRRTPVPVVPVGMQGLWGSVFSKATHERRRRLPWQRSRVTLRVGSPVAPENATAAALERMVDALLLPN